MQAFKSDINSPEKNAFETERERYKLEVMRKRELLKSRKETPRQIKKNSQGVIKTMVNPKRALGVVSQVKISDLPIFVALMAAALKDILDIVLGVIPGLSSILAVCVGALIFFMFLLSQTTDSDAGYNTYKSTRKIIKSNSGMGKYLIIMGGTVFEMIIGLDILPIESTSVLIAYYLLLANRKIAAEENKKIREAENAYAV